VTWRKREAQWGIFAVVGGWRRHGRQEIGGGGIIAAIGDGDDVAGTIQAVEHHHPFWV